MLAHSSATTAAPASTTAPPVSASRNPRMGAARLRAHAVRPAGAPAVSSAAAISGSSRRGGAYASLGGQRSCLSR